MYSLVQFSFRCRRAFRNALLMRAALILVATIVAVPSLSRAQNPPPGAIGRVEGNDISVEGGSASGNNSATSAPSILVSNGSIVTVHSGQARLTLATGGEVDICGPAKMTLLQSGTSLTLAVNFGHVRVQLPASADFRIFTPTIVATPIDIGGAPRDITVGLELDDSLCVLATSGAIQLEHQFTGDKLIVPQLGEFFLSEGKLVPVAAPSGGCQCAAMPAQPQPRVLTSPAPTIPETGLTAPLETTQAPPQSTPRSGVPETEPSVEFSIPAHSNEDHPVASPSKSTATPQAPPSVPVQSVVAPLLTFSANSPAPPPDPTPDMILLVREARVDPEYEFSGHVDPPIFAQALQHALGEGNSPAEQPGPAPAKKRRGLWSRLKSIF